MMADLRGMQGQAVQERYPGGARGRKEHQRCAQHDCDMMVDAGCVLVFREGKMISFAKNNKKKREISFPPSCF